MNAIDQLLSRCTTNEVRAAAIECLASGMTVQEILSIIDRLAVAR
jgi:hypothetical protein